MMGVEQLVNWLVWETEVLEVKPSQVPLLSTTNNTLYVLGSNPGRRSVKPATNHLIYAMVCSRLPYCTPAIQALHYVGDGSLSLAECQVYKSDIESNASMRILGFSLSLGRRFIGATAEL
jgi:hypothetical protein